MWAAISGNATARCELDSHADTCAFGQRSTFLISTLSDKISVSGFHPKMETILDVKIASVAVAYDCVSTLSTYILFFHNVLYIPSMEVNLLCPDQLREHGVKVNDIPLLRIPPQERTIEHHSIIEPQSGLHIPLEYNKPFSFFTVRKPTRNEVFDSINNMHVTLTSELEWNPYDQRLAEDEIAI